MQMTEINTEDPRAYEAGEHTIVLEVQRKEDGAVIVRVHSAAKPADPALGAIAGQLHGFASAVGRAVNDLDDEGRLRRSVPSERMKPVTRALSHVADVLVGSAWDNTVTADELRTRLQVTTDAVDVVFHGGTEELESLIIGLVPPPAESDPARAEARGRLRLQALYRKLIRDSYTVKELANQRLSRQRLQQLRSEDRIFAVEVPHHKGLLHPRWQFGRDGRPRPEMPDLIAAARDADLDAIAFHQLMLNPEAADDGAPVDLLDEGRIEEAIDIVRAGGG